MSAPDDHLAVTRSTAPRPVTQGRSLAGLAIEKTRQDADRIIVREAGRAISRGEMLDAARRLGGALISRGIQPGASIAFQLPNWWEACVINLAAALFSYRLTPLLTIYRQAELGVMLPACAVKAIFVPETYRGFDFPSLVARVDGGPRHIFTVRGDRSSPNAFETLVGNAPAEPTPAAGEDVKMTLFTSGSTGRPKGVMHSHATIDALIRRTADFWGTGPDDGLYIPSPIGHIGGSIYAFEFPWITDCTAILAESWDADAAVRAIDGAGATFMAGATPFLAGLIAAADRAGTSLPSLRRYVCGGASVPPEMVRRGLERFPNAIVSRAYGSTEVPLVCPGARSRGEAERRADTDGEISVEIRILDDEGNPVAEGASGEIVVRGPQMLLGYLDPADDEGSFTPDGYFRMGDLGRRVDGKYLEITGRKKDIIIRKGENISPLEIENALARHPSVRQSAVVGVPDQERGEIAVAFVLPVDGAGFTFADMVGHLDALGLARQKFPERLQVVSSLPVNSIGKVQKNELRALSIAAGGEQR
jgi:acyl-CoA synthetase (AMP-forming)/AMP-acid ligase II